MEFASELPGPPVGADGKPLPLCGTADRRNALWVDLTGGVNLYDKDGGYDFSLRTCLCDSGPRGRVVDPDAQRRVLAQRQQVYSGCKIDACAQDGTCDFWQTDPTECLALGYVHGFVSRDTGGVGGTAHDGDEDPLVCPFDLGVSRARSPQPEKNIDLRTTHWLTPGEIHYGALKVEWQWCRWFGGPVALHEPSGLQSWLDFRPMKGERVSMVGDWVVEGGHSEIHEVRMGATVRQDKNRPNAPVYHLFTSGFFADETANQTFVALNVPVPRPSDPTMSKLVCEPVSLDRECVRSSEDVRVRITADPAQGSCNIVLERRSDAMRSSRKCGNFGINCPCFGKDWSEEPNRLVSGPTCQKANIISTGQFDSCNPPSHNGTVTHIALAQDVRAEWKDPVDQWQCICDCDDPSAPGAVIPARLQGCVTPHLEPEGENERRVACTEVCAGGKVCGEAPACRLGSCRASATSHKSAQLIARRGCEPPAPEVRVAEAGDYRVELLHALSTIELGKMNGSDFVSQAITHTRGTLWVNDDRNPSDRRLELADFQLQADPFEVKKGIFGITPESVLIDHAQAFLVRRFPAEYGPKQVVDRTLAPNELLVRPTRLQFGVRATVDGVLGGMERSNSGPATGSFDMAAGTLTFGGIGQSQEGDAVRLSLVGFVANRPPVANPGSDQTVECQSPTVTPVRLDASASTDPDPGQTIEHYQWFEGNAGLSNQSSLTQLATLGTHFYDLHVYDADLASDRRRHRVEVVDTTPPELTLAVTELCLWPPDHEYALFKLGQELAYSATDRCDANPPEVQIVKVESDEADSELGSGSTAPDAVSGKTTACVRAERSGLGLERRYTVTIEARDHAKPPNIIRRQVTVVVPHDKSQHPGCQRARGVDFPDSACRQ